MGRSLLILLMAIMGANAFGQTINKSAESLTTLEGEKKVIVRGVGTDSDQALKNAFENAVNEAIGALVSSETRIENDALIKDEIRLYSKGFIKTYKILSESGQSDKYEVLLAAIVTEKQIFESLKAKGVSVSYNTKGMFAKIDEWESKKSDELKMAESIFSSSNALVNQNPFDYNIVIDDPLKMNDATYKVPILIEATPNANYFNYLSDFKRTLAELAFDNAKLQLTEKVSFLNPNVFHIYQSYSFSHYFVDNGQMDKSRKYKAVKDVVGIATYKGDARSGFFANTYYFLFIISDYADKSSFSRILNNIELSRASQLIQGPCKIDGKTAFLFKKDYSPFILMLIEGSDESVADSELQMRFQKLENKAISCFNFINSKTAELALNSLYNKMKIFRCVLKITFIDGTNEEIPLQESSILNIGQTIGIPYNGYAMFFNPKPAKIQFKHSLSFKDEKLKKIKEIKIEPL